MAIERQWTELLDENCIEESEVFELEVVVDARWSS